MDGNGSSPPPALAGHHSNDSGLETTPGAPTSRRRCQRRHHAPDTSLWITSHTAGAVWTPWSSAAFASNSSTATLNPLKPPPRQDPRRNAKQFLEEAPNFRPQGLDCTTSRFHSGRPARFLRRCHRREAPLDKSPGTRQRHPELRNPELRTTPVEPAPTARHAEGRKCPKLRPSI